MGNQEQGNLNGTDALTANPDAIAIFGGNDPTALGAYAAAEAAGSDALIYGVDGSPDVKALVAEGGITGTGAQSPINIGKTIAEVYYQWEGRRRGRGSLSHRDLHDQRGQRCRVRHGRLAVSRNTALTRIQP